MRDIYDVTDDLFKVFERIRDMFRHWKREYHMEFIAEVRKLDVLDQELEELTGDKHIAYLIRVGIYRSIFPDVPKYK